MAREHERHADRKRPGCIRPIDPGPPFADDRIGRDMQRHLGELAPHPLRHRAHLLVELPLEHRAIGANDSLDVGRRRRSMRFDKCDAVARRGLVQRRFDELAQRRGVADHALLNRCLEAVRKRERADRQYRVAELQEAHRAGDRAHCDSRWRFGTAGFARTARLFGAFASRLISSRSHRRNAASFGEFASAGG